MPDNSHHNLRQRPKPSYLNISKGRVSSVSDDLSQVSIHSPYHVAVGLANRTGDRVQQTCPNQADWTAKKQVVRALQVRCPCDNG